MSLKHFIASGFITLLFLLSGSVLAFQNAQSELLSTPKKSLHTFLHWQQTGHMDLSKAALTMKLLEGTEEERIELATELKKVLDARGLLVEYENVPNTRNYVDSLSGLQQYILFDELPDKGDHC